MIFLSILKIVQKNSEKKAAGLLWAAQGIFSSKGIRPQPLDPGNARHDG